MTRLLYIGNKLSKSGSTPTAIEILGPELEAAGFRVSYSSSNPNKAARLVEMIVKTATTDADFVLIDTYSTLNFWYAVAVAAICRLRKIKYIPILHGGNLPERLKNNPSQSRMLFSNSHINVAPSEYLRSAFSAFNVRLIENPVPLAGFDFKIREVVSPTLLWVRSLAPIYNPAMALHAAAELKKSYPGTRLTMVGPDKGELRNLEGLALKLGIDVTFTGRLERGEWAELAKGHDIFLNTSNADNAPFSVFEAMSLGLYVVSTNVGGIPFIITNGKSGILVNANDASAMADAVRNILKDAALRGEIRRGSGELLKTVNPASVVAKWREILVVLP